MKLILHIVRKDLRRLRWPLAAWLLLVAAKIAFGFVLIFSESVSGGVRDAADGFVKCTMLLEGVLTFFLTAMLVQEDSLVGSTQFWVTRPISGARLLAAKFAGWLLLLWLPAVVLMLPWWITCALGPRAMTGAALEMLVLQAVAAAPAVLVASLTGTFSRFIAWAPVLIFGFATISLMLSFEIPGIDQNVDPRVHAVAGWGVLLLVAAGVVVRQFLRRDMVGSLVWFGGGCVAAALVGVFFPMRWMERALTPEARWTSWHAERAEGVTLVPHSFRGGGQNGAGEVWLNTYLEVRGLPQGLTIADGPAARQTWRWPGGPEVNRFASWMRVSDSSECLRPGLGIGPPQVDEETARFYAKRDEEQQRKNGYEGRVAPPRMHVEVVTSVLPSTINRLKRTPPAYDAKVLLRLVRPVMLHTVPLKAGGWHASEGRGFRVGESRASLWRPPNPEMAPSRHLTAGLVTTNVEFMWVQWLGHFGGGENELGPNLVVAFPAANELQGRHRWRFYATATIGSVGVLIDNLWMGRSSVRRGDKWELPDANWADGAKVALIGYQEEARFAREVKAERFENAK